MTHVLGIDLGGTTVSAAIADDVGRVEMVALGDRSTTVPSVVHRRDAASLVTGELAARRASGDPAHAAWSLRRRLGDPAPVVLGDDAVPAGDLLAAILRDVLARVTAVRGLEPDRVVLTHPASWGPYRRGLFEDLIAAAGLEDAVTTADPEAAGQQHRAVHGLDDGTALAVYDLGGSSFEATVLARRGRALELVGTPVGIERLGGVDLDEAVIALVDEATGGMLADLDPDDDSTAAALARLRQDCVAAKEALSTDDEAIVPVLLPGRHADVTVARGPFEERIRSSVARSVEALERAVGSAPVRPSAVLLVGGSSRVPLIERLVGERLGLPVIIDPRPEEVVALGAARAAQAAAPSVTRVTSMVGMDLPGRSGAGRSSRSGGGADAGAAETAAAAETASADASPAEPAPTQAVTPTPAVTESATTPPAATTASSAPAATAASPAPAATAASPSPEREPDPDPASTTLVPSPIVDGRVPSEPDESRTTVTRTTPSGTTPSDESRTTVTRTTPSDPAKTTVVRPTSGAGTPSTGTPSTGRPPAGNPPRRPAGPPPRQNPGRPAPPSGSFPAQGRPGGPGPGPGGPNPGGPYPGGPGPGGQGPRPGWPGGAPGGRPGGPPPGRPMTGPFPGPAGPGPGGPGPTSPQPGPTSSSSRTRTVIVVAAAVVVVILLVVALVLTGVL